MEFKIGQRKNPHKLTEYLPYVLHIASHYNVVYSILLVSNLGFPCSSNSFSTTRRAWKGKASTEKQFESRFSSLFEVTRFATNLEILGYSTCSICLQPLARSKYIGFWDKKRCESLRNIRKSQKKNMGEKYWYCQAWSKYISLKRSYRHLAVPAPCGELHFPRHPLREERKKKSAGNFQWVPKLGVNAMQPSIVELFIVGS